MNGSRSYGDLGAVEAETGGRGVWSAWLVHGFTSVGLVAGLLGLVAVIDGRAGAAIGWLLVATVIDAVDGPLARVCKVAESLPQIDGHMLDAVVDFVGTVLVPLVFLWRFELLPDALALPVVGVAVVTSGLWFSRTDMMTEDHWFNGFPTAWNLVVPTLFLFRLGAPLNAVIVLVLAALQLSNVKFVHPGRVVELRTLTLAITATWILTIAVLTGMSYGVAWPARAALLIGPAYQMVLSLRRTHSEYTTPAGAGGPVDGLAQA